MSRSCQGCAATDLLAKDETILSLSGGGDGEEVATLFGVSIGGDISATLNEWITQPNEANEHTQILGHKFTNNNNRVFDYTLIK